MDIESYLGSLNLSQYTRTFIENGYDTVADVSILTLEELCDDIGLKKGHARKILKNLPQQATDSEDEKDPESNGRTTHQYTHAPVQQEQKEVSLVFLGETGVGKTTLLESLKDFMRTTPFEHVDSTEKPQEVGKSQTKDPLRLDLANEEFKVTLIDTPGIADTEGIAADTLHVNKITEFLGNMVAFNAICIVLPCSVTRATVQLRYIIGEIKANLPKDAMSNFVVVLTRAAGVIMPSSDAIGVIQKLGLPLDNVFLVDNRAYESLSEEHRQRMPQLYKRARVLQKQAYQENQEKLRMLLMTCSEYPQYQGSKVKALRIKRHQLKASVANCKRVIDNCFKQEEEVQRMRNDLLAAQDDAERLEATVRDMKAKQIEYEDFVPRADGRVRTVCSICGTHSKCHNPCGNAYGTPIEWCSSIDGTTNKCRMCGCPGDKHAHSKVFPVKRYRSLFEESNGQQIEGQMTAAQRRQRTFERNMTRLSRETENLKRERAERMQDISGLYSELEEMAIVGFNESFEEYLQQCKEQVDRDDSLTSDAAREKKTLYEESISQFRVVVSAARNKLTDAWNWIRGDEA